MGLARKQQVPETRKCLSALTRLPINRNEQAQFLKESKDSFWPFQGTTFLLLSPFPFSSRIKSAKHAVGICLAHESGTWFWCSVSAWITWKTWSTEQSISIRAPWGGGDIILKVICIVFIHLLCQNDSFLILTIILTKIALLVCGRGILYLSQSLTTVDLFILFLELRMNWITGIIETEIPRWQTAGGEGHWLSQPDALPT